MLWIEERLVCDYPLSYFCEGGFDFLAVILLTILKHGASSQNQMSSQNEDVTFCCI